MYGLPAGTNIPYGGSGFPGWVYSLCAAFNLRASTYPNHQESERAEAGFAPNPQRLNRGIDWAGTVPDMQRFAEYLLSVRHVLEQVIWQNPQTGQRIGVAGGDDVSNTGYYQADYSGHRDHVHTRQAEPIPLPEGTVGRPDFNEYFVMTPNNYQSRGGTKIDLFILHTQEGSGNADSLARWLSGPVNASYHYTVSQDMRDNGVTVCDVVDTDYASWSVLDANNRSINLCFAGSKAAWTTAEWMRNSKALDAAAWLAVQDCRKYNIPFTVIAPPYTARAGITDHAYVTKILKTGTHTDVGPNFPWKYFASKVAEYSGTTPPPAPEKQYPRDFTDRELWEDIWKKVSKL